MVCGHCVLTIPTFAFWICSTAVSSSLYLVLNSAVVIYSYHCLSVGDSQGNSNIPKGLSFFLGFLSWTKYSTPYNISSIIYVGEENSFLQFDECPGNYSYFALYIKIYLTGAAIMEHDRETHLQCISPPSTVIGSLSLFTTCNPHTIYKIYGLLTGKLKSEQVLWWLPSHCPLCTRSCRFQKGSIISKHALHF